MRTSYIGIVLVCVMCGCGEQIDDKYPPYGRDTIQVYKKGRYQIGWYAKEKILTDEEEGNAGLDLFRNVHKWEKVGNTLLLSNTFGKFMVLDLETSKATQYDNLSDTPEHLQVYFRRLLPK